MHRHTGFYRVLQKRASRTDDQGLGYTHPFPAAKHDTESRRRPHSVGKTPGLHAGVESIFRVCIGVTEVDVALEAVILGYLVQ